MDVTDWIMDIGYVVQCSYFVNIEAFQNKATVKPWVWPLSDFSLSTERTYCIPLMSDWTKFHPHIPHPIMFLTFRIPPCVNHYKNTGL